MQWRERLRNRNVVRALVGLGVALGGASIALVEPGTSILCALVGCG